MLVCAWLLAVAVVWSPRAAEAREAFKPQKERISVTFRNATLAEVLQQVKRMTGYYILYNSDFVQDVKGITFSRTNAPVREVLDEALRGTRLEYSIDDDTIVVGVTKDLTGRYSAIDLVRIASQTVGGQGGGGRPDMAQAGGPNGEKIADAINAVKEAKRLNIPVFAMVDTCCDPTDIDYVIPANDDATKSIAVVLDAVTAAIAEGLAERKLEKEKEAAQKDTKEKEAKPRIKKAAKTEAVKVNEEKEAPAAEEEAAPAPATEVQETNEVKEPADAE